MDVFRNLGPELRRTVNGREVKHEDPVLVLLFRVQLQVQEHHEVFERGHRLPIVLCAAAAHLNKGFYKLFMVVRGVFG